MMSNNHAEPRLSTYLHARAGAKGIPISGTFELTPRCNLSCRMCYVRMTPAEQAAVGRELTTREWLDIAESAREAGMLFLLITGGEPLIRSDFRELFCKLKAMGLMISINTNASLIDDDWLEFFAKEPPFRFNISLYGAHNEAYERLCGAPRGSNVGDRVKHNIRALKEMGVGVKLNLSLTPYNRADMGEIFAIAEELGVPIQAATYMFPPLRRDAENIGGGDRFTPAEEAECAMEWDRLRFNSETLAARCAAIVRGCELPDDAECGSSPDRGMRCRAGRSSFWINWRGDLTPCGMMNEPKVSLLDTDFMSAWTRIRSATAEIVTPAECAACRYRNSCHVCAAACVCETGRSDRKPEHICRAVERTVELAVKELQKNKSEVENEDQKEFG